MRSFISDFKLIEIMQVGNGILKFSAIKNYEVIFRPPCIFHRHLTVPNIFFPVNSENSR